MNMICVNADWVGQSVNRSLLQMRNVRLDARPANRAIINDQHGKVGSFINTPPEDRDKLLDLLEKAFAGI